MSHQMRLFSGPDVPPLESLDLSKSLVKKAFKKRMAELELRLGHLQRRARDLGIPVVAVFEGWGASGKGSQINRLLLSIDPRGVSVIPIHPPSEEERHRPFFWRFWTKTPERGRLAIFDRSWYGRFLVEGMDPSIRDKIGPRAYREVTSFERQLVDDGFILVKYFLHISRGEQEQRFHSLEANPATAWRVTPNDWKKHNQYGKFLKITNAMFQETHTTFAPWTVVEAEDWRYATVKVFTTLVRRLEAGIEAVERAETPPDEAAGKSRSIPNVLSRYDLTTKAARKDYKRDVDRYQERVRELEHEIYRRRLGVIVLYEGWDAAGKGGNIRRLVQRMDPRGYEVIPIAAPNDAELAHHYLWRFWNRMPKAGHIAIFDRSWYGRVLVERVEGYSPEPVWRRAYQEINEIEEHLVNFGTVLIKFWMHIDAGEQLQRFQARQENPAKRWKITEDDWRNRDKWDQYQMAVNEMLHRTDTSHAPWTIVESNDKHYARLKTLRTFCAEVEKGLR